MRIHYLQHESHEGLGNIERWANRQGAVLSRTAFYDQVEFPNHADYDWLVVMGGSMGVYEESRYPWLKAEKVFIGEAISCDKPVLGICLGSQLLAEVLGGRVYPGAEKEIGWFPVEKIPDASETGIFAALPPIFPALHWHGDTFDLPPNVRHLASSAAYANQAFQYKNNVLALQFHLELGFAETERFVRQANGLADVSAPFVQSGAEILEPKPNFAESERLLGLVLAEFAKLLG